MRTVFFWLLSFFLFLLPWQTRWIWRQGEINGVPWEYGTFSIYTTEIIFWLAAIFLLISLWQQQKLKIAWREKNRKVSGIIGLLIFYFVFSILHSLSPEISYQYIFHLLEGLAVVSCIVILRDNSVIPAKAGIQASEQIPDPGSRFGMTSGIAMKVALWLGGVVQGIIACWQFFSQNISANKWLGLASHAPQDLGTSVVEFGGERWLRAYGSFGSPNSLGIYLAVCLIVGLIIYNNLHENNWRKILISSGQVIITTGLVLSFSRSAWLAAACGLLFYFLLLIGYPHFSSVIPAKAGIQTSLSNNRPDSRPRSESRTSFRGNDKLIGFIKQLLIISAPIVCLFIIFQPLFLARFNTENRLEYKSVNERVGQYTEFKKVFSEYPLFGVGPGAYTFTLSKMKPNVNVYELQPTHNIYLLTLAEWGIVGSIFWLVIYGFWSWQIWKNNKIWIPVIFVLLVAGLFDHWSYTLYAGMILWWVIWGLELQKK